MFYVATVGQGTASQPGYARTTKALYRDIVAPRCVAIENAMRVQQTKFDAHNKASAPRLGVHDRDILSRQIFLYRDKEFFCRDTIEEDCDDTLDSIVTLIKANDSETLSRQSLLCRNIKE